MTREQIGQGRTVEDLEVGESLTWNTSGAADDIVSARGITIQYVSKKLKRPIKISGTLNIFKTHETTATRIG